jgi:hypothetical protein
MSNPLAGNKLPLLEIQQHLDQIMRHHPALRLLVDMARDAVGEAARQHTQLQAGLRRARKQRQRMRQQRAELLDALVASGQRLAGDAAAASSEEVMSAYRTLRDTFPERATELEAVAQRGESRDFRRVLVERVLLRGQRTLAEALVRKPTLTDRAALHTRLAEHLLRRVGRYLARRFGCTIDRTLRHTLMGLITDSLNLLEAMLRTNDPPLRLLWPRRGSLFQLEWHERLGEKPSHQPRDVRAVLFPGLVQVGKGQCLARALVATQRQKPTGA